MAVHRAVGASTPSHSPSRLSIILSNTTPDISNASSTQALSGLALEDVELIDAIIERAPASATTFLTVFKAYNEILQERGLNAEDDVVYYRRLLKLGVVKGKDWGDKWRTVKLQLGYGGSGYSEKSAPRFRSVPDTHNMVLLSRRKPLAEDLHHYDDTFTLHSHQADSEELRTDLGADVSLYESSRDQLVSGDSAVRPPTYNNTLELNVGPSVCPPFPTSTQLLPMLLPLTPPSYRAVVQETAATRADSIPLPRRRLDLEWPLPMRSQVRHEEALQAPKQREHGGSVINEHEAWKKVRMARDEQDADRFREERLVEQCWKVWCQGLRWIYTTHEQVGQARDSLTLRICMQRWRRSTTVRLEIQQRVATVVDARIINHAVTVWRARLKEKKALKWRNNMRANIKTTRMKREEKLRKDAWAKWRQLYQSHLSGQHYMKRLLLRCFNRWKDKLINMDRSQVVADEFERVRDERILDRCWSHWKIALELRNAEKVVSGKVSFRIVRHAMEVWKRNGQDTHIAETFHDELVIKTAFRAWIATQSRLRDMEQKAFQFINRQRDLLIRATTRVWVARERGLLLRRVRSARFVNAAWIAWKGRKAECRELEERACVFYKRPQSSLLSASLLVWLQVLKTRHNALSFAAQYHDAQLRFKMLVKWRIGLRAILKMSKQARLARKSFVAHRAMMIWKGRVVEKRRDQKLQLFLYRRLQKIFCSWLQRSRQIRYRKLAEQEVKKRLAWRIMKWALSYWTSRVIDLKLRGLEMAEKYEKQLQVAAFAKWKALCIRHVEELSLMESYQDVKLEEMMRRMFHGWLCAARAARHRRVTLQERERNLKHAILLSTWHKWRDRFQDERLRPVEYTVMIQGQKNHLYRAFGLWHTRTKSLPAIRFDSVHTKFKFWCIWRDAMPHALQAKKAREADKNAILGKVFKKWVETCRTKIALKAVARARYLRLPTASPRRAAQAPRPTFPLFTGQIRSRSQDIHPPETGSSSRRNSLLPPITSRSAVSSLLATKPSSRRIYASSATRSDSLNPTRRRSPASTSRQSVVGTRERDMNPPRPSSDTGDDRGIGGRSRLWAELREAQKLSRSGRELHRPQEPP